MKALVAAVVLVLAAPASADSFHGTDKLIHAGVSATIGAGCYGLGHLALDRRAPGARIGLALLSFGAAVAVGGVKELWDGSGHGDASPYDFGADVLGAAAGTGIALTIDLVVNRHR